ETADSASGRSISGSRDRGLYNHMHTGDRGWAARTTGDRDLRGRGRSSLVGEGANNEGEGQGTPPDRVEQGVGRGFSIGWRSRMETWGEGGMEGIMGMGNVGKKVVGVGGKCTWRGKELSWAP
ncbi:hypothetical protein Salat_2436500, partial [Sesamum alatum]